MLWMAYLAMSMTRYGVKAKRIVMPSGVESATVLCEGLVVEPVDQFLAHLTAIERSPNTVKAYAHDLRDYFEFLQARGLRWDQVLLEDLGRFVTWLRLPEEALSTAMSVWLWRKVCDRVTERDRVRLSSDDRDPATVRT